jgi:hypothetical protein
MHKQAVEICFDGAFGHVQIASDFRVVTALEQQIDDLAFPWSQLLEFLFHNHCTCPTSQTRQLARKVGPSSDMESGCVVSFCIHAAKSGPRLLL